jgi:carbonic anhydrase/acetyltransferase-like protein (isoleucine patch superfamily)
MPLFRLGEAEPDLADDCWVAPTAVLIGRVRLLSNASVWWNAVLRGDNEWIEVGDGSNVQDGAVCHTDMGFPLTIGANVTVGHQAMLHGCTVGNGALIGIGAVVLNGAVVERNALLGAKALVPEGKTIPEGTLAVGALRKRSRTSPPGQRAMRRTGSAFVTTATPCEPARVLSPPGPAATRPADGGRWPLTAR